MELIEGLPVIINLTFFDVEVSPDSFEDGLEGFAHTAPLYDEVKGNISSVYQDVMLGMVHNIRNNENDEENLNKAADHVFSMCYEMMQNLGLQDETINVYNEIKESKGSIVVLPIIYADMMIYLNRMIELSNEVYDWFIDIQRRNEDNEFDENDTFTDDELVDFDDDSDYFADINTHVMSDEALNEKE